MEINSENAYALLFFIPDASLKDCQSEIVCCTAQITEEHAFSILRTLLSEILHTLYFGGSFYEIKLSGLWNQCLYELLSKFRNPDFNQIHTSEKQHLIAGGQQDQAFREILYILERDYSKNLQLSELAKLFYYTPSHLSKMFVRYTGLHFTEYLTELRLKKAMPLLLQTRLEISAISEKVGFSNPRAFQQAFQKKYHMRPSRYRTDFQNISEGDSPENIRQNLHYIQSNGLLDKFLYYSVSDHQQTDTSGHLHLGSFCMQRTHTIDIASKNNYINVYSAKDLLLEEIQDEIRTLQREIGFTYINCREFLADDMQIIFEDILNLYKKRERLKYNFFMQEQVLQISKDLDLRLILHLGYVPSFLTEEGIRKNQSSIGKNDIYLPRDMEEWEEYLRQLLLALHQKAGDWLFECPVQLWAVPDIQIYKTKIWKKESFYELYRCTCQTIRSVFPQMKIGSPTITCTQIGLDFEKDFLEYCMEHNCMPDMINLIYTDLNQSHKNFHISPVGCRELVSHIRNDLRALGVTEEIPIHLMEYYYSFDISPVCDSMIGAMLPLQVTLQNYEYFNCMGYHALSDRTTLTVFGNSQFCSGRRIFTLAGGKKAVFYSLKFLSRLGTDCLGKGNGYIITRKSDKIQILLYYDIPMQEWIEEFTRENAFSFYQMYPEQTITLDIIDLHSRFVVIKEQYLNYDEGSAYEEWLSSGAPNLEGTDLDNICFDSAPRVLVSRQRTTDNCLHYQCTLKPFEIRLAEISSVPEREK
ncbi:MAG: helix-turn-helix domain-containing protein [Clostridiales bacterium]|nr:helix-turn-helix domain-containing protein [Clostridiales bacterium]